MQRAEALGMVQPQERAALVAPVAKGLLGMMVPMGAEVEQVLAAARVALAAWEAMARAVQAALHPALMNLAYQGSREGTAETEEMVALEEMAQLQALVAVQDLEAPVVLVAREGLGLWRGANAALMVLTALREHQAQMD